MGLIVSWLSLHNLHLLFCCVLSILALIWLSLKALFCASKRRDSVSLVSFTFFGHVNVFSCEMSLVSRLKCPYSCFTSHFFPVIVVPLLLAFWVFFLVTVICLPSRFLSRSIDSSTLSSMLASPLLSFFMTYNLSTSSLWCKAVCIVISFLVFWFVSLSSSMIQEWSRVSYEEDSLLLGSCFILWFQAALLFSWDTFLIFVHLHLFDCISFQYSQVFVCFLFSECSGIFLDLVVSFLHLCVVSRFSFVARRFFLRHSPSICPDSIFSPPIFFFIFIYSIIYLLINSLFFY